MKHKEKLKGAVIGAIVTFILMTAVPALARTEVITVHFNSIRIAIDGRLVQTENEPFIYQGRTYLPTRDVADAMGYDVTWENSTNTVHLTSRGSLNIAPDYPPHQPLATPLPTSPAVSLERAVEIAYNDLSERGINAAFRSDSGMSWERGQWVWELLFRTQGERKPFIEFYISVDNGNIVKFEWDD
jgi:hypothetical protein